jgi:hypothetical protein
MHFRSSWRGITVIVHQASRAELDHFLEHSSGAPTALTNTFMRKTQWGLLCMGLFSIFQRAP